jgi:hypothetical protein
MFFEAAKKKNVKCEICEKDFGKSDEKVQADKKTGKYLNIMDYSDFNGSNLVWPLRLKKLREFTKFKIFLKEALRIKFQICFSSFYSFRNIPKS